MKFVIKLLLLVAVSIAIGCQTGNSESDLPKNCIEQGIEYKNNNLVLNEGSSSKQSLYLFHNISDKSFWLNHPVTKDPGASAGWASELNSGNWSALTINGNTDNFTITCSIIGDGGVNYLDCKEVVKTCRLQKAIFNSEDSGNYWVAEDKSLENLLETIKERRISW